jgi:hypothetical protein
MDNANIVSVKSWASVTDYDKQRVVRHVVSLALQAAVSALGLPEYSIRTSPRPTRRSPPPALHTAPLPAPPRR